MPALQNRILFCFLLGISSCLWGETELEKAARLIEGRNFQEAQVLLDRVVQIEPRNAEAWFQMGRLQLRTKKRRQ